MTVRPRPSRVTFYVQIRPRENWHVESEDPEHMLCDQIILVDEGIVTTSRPRNVCPECAAKESPRE